MKQGRARCHPQAAIRTVSELSENVSPHSLPCVREEGRSGQCKAEETDHG